MSAARPLPILIWIRAMRVPYFTGAAMAVVCGAAAAYCDRGALRISFFLVALVGAVSIHAASNIVNDYFDYKNGCDTHNQVRGALNGGSRVGPCHEKEKCRRSDGQEAGPVRLLCAAGPYLSVPGGGGVLTGVLSPWVLLSWAVLPAAARAALTLHRHYEEPAALLPAQITMIRLHFATGLLMTAGLLLGKWVG